MTHPTTPPFRAGAARCAVVLSLLGALVSPLPIVAQESDLEGIGFVKGSADAPVVVVEYADFACSACAEFARESWPIIDKEYIERGLVRWRFVPFELGFRNSDEGARAAQCSALLGDFWTAHDLLFERQSEWSGERNPDDELAEIATAAGLDTDSFRQCYDDDPGEERTAAANRAARTDRVRGTPTFFIDGFRVQGAIPATSMKELIDASLEGAGRAATIPGRDEAPGHVR